MQSSKSFRFSDSYEYSRHWLKYFCPIIHFFLIISQPKFDPTLSLSAGAILVKTDRFKLRNRHVVISIRVISNACQSKLKASYNLERSKFSTLKDRVSLKLFSFDTNNPK